MGMQKQITAKRGQIDALQSKVQFLEEAVTSANKVSLSCETSMLARSPAHWLMHHKAEGGVAQEVQLGRDFPLGEWGEVSKGILCEEFLNLI